MAALPIGDTLWIVWADIAMILTGLFGALSSTHFKWVRGSSCSLTARHWATLIAARRSFADMHGCSSGQSYQAPRHAVRDDQLTIQRSTLSASCARPRAVLSLEPHEDLTRRNKSQHTPRRVDNPHRSHACRWDRHACNNDSRLLRSASCMRRVGSLADAFFSCSSSGAQSALVATVCSAESAAVRPMLCSSSVTVNGNLTSTRLRITGLMHSAASTSKFKPARRHSMRCLCDAGACSYTA